MDDRMREAMSIVRSNSVISGAVVLIPIPIIDLAGIAGIQVRMIRDLAKVYDVEFTEIRGKAVASGLVGGILPYLLAEGSEGFLLSFAKTVPIIGPLVSLMAMPGFASASTYTIGKVFAQHFAGGGSLLDFDAEAKKRDIKKEFEQRRGAVEKDAAPAASLGR